MKHLVRIASTTALLVVVWRHAHWSVALVLTLLSIGGEIDSFCLNELMASVKTLMERQR